MKLLTVKQVISLRTLGNAQRTVWKIYIEIEKYVFFVLSRVWDKEKIQSPHEESNLRLSDSALRCSTTEPQRLHGERDLLRSSYDTRLAYC